MSDINVADDGSQATSAKPNGKRPGRPIDPNSVLAKCKALFLPLVQQGLTRPEILKEFQTRFGLKPGSSQVYYHDSKNAAEAAGHTITVKRSASKRAAKTSAAPASTGVDSSING